MHRIVSQASDNLLLSDLPASECDWVQGNAQPVPLQARTVLHRSDQVLEHAYFPQSGYVSLVSAFADGFQVETGQVGREGMTGIPVVLGAKRDTVAAVVHAPGVALRISATALAGCLNELPVLKARLLQYAATSRAQAMQLAACNGHHNLEARLARCLLNIRDRCDSNMIPATHQTLADLLCAHRPSVSVSVKRLELSGLLKCSSGSITIADRDKLEQKSCECYGLLRVTRPTWCSTMDSTARLTVE